MTLAKPDTPATRKIRRIDQAMTNLFRQREQALREREQALRERDQAMTNLFRQREQALRERGAELGFKPCGDCFDGFCTMNCSSAPIIMKVFP